MSAKLLKMFYNSQIVFYLFSNVNNTTIKACTFFLFVQAFKNVMSLRQTQPKGLYTI